MPAIPASLRDCRDAPRWDDIERRARQQYGRATQREVAEFIALYREAHRDCQTKLRAMDRLLRKVEARAKQNRRS